MRRAYTKVFAESLDQGGARRTTRSSRSPPRCRPAPASTCSASSFPTRTFDVGIAEQHAVTFAAGLAAEGYKPFCAIYSTFLQRAYDQVVHDVAIQNLPVRFAHRPRRARRRRRADPCRHLRRRLSRLPARLRGDGRGGRGRARAHGRDRGRLRRRPDRLPLPARRGRRASRCRNVGVPLAIGRGRILREGDRVAHPLARHAARGGARRRPRNSRPGACRRRSPTRASPSRSTTSSIAAARARARGADHRSRKDRSAASAATCCSFWPSAARSTEGLKVRPLVLPDCFIDHDKPERMYAGAGLDAAGIVAKVFEALGREEPILKARA